MPTYGAKDLIKGYTLDENQAKVPIPADVMDQVAITIEDVRGELRDYPHLNELVRYELTDDEYCNCVVDAIAEFNAAPPMFTQYGPKDFPDRKLLEDMAVAGALQKLYTWHARQQWSAQDAGLQVPIHEQWQPLLQIARHEEARNDDRMNKLKARLNVANGWSGVGSPGGWGWL